MKGTLHMLDADDKPKNTHIIFTDSKKEGERILILPKQLHGGGISE